jgi:hypothetical protein
LYSFTSINRNAYLYFKFYYNSCHIFIFIFTESKLQSIAGKTNTANVATQKDEFLHKQIINFLAKASPIKDKELLSKDLEALPYPHGNNSVDMPMETCIPGETENLHEAQLHKGRTRLSLTRRSKRNVHDQKVQQYYTLQSCLFTIIHPINLNGQTLVVT